MNLAQNIHNVMKRAGQRRDLFLWKTNDAGYQTAQWQEVNQPKFL
jgi:hypothetical protein